MGEWGATRAVVLGLVGGYVDTTGYIMLRGLFPNHVTGNLPIAAAHPGPGAIPLLVMVPLWLGAVVVSAVAAREIGRRQPEAVMPRMLAAEVLLLALFLVLGVALVPDRHASTEVTQTIVGAAGVAAMGLQSVISRLGGYAFPTTMVTGTLTLLGMDMAEPDKGVVVSTRIRAFRRVAIAFGAGAVLGGAVTAAAQFWACAVPVVLVAGCVVGETRSRRHGGATCAGGSRRRPAPAGWRSATRGRPR